MTVFINARFLTQPTSGVQRYASELLGALDRRLQRDRDLRHDLGSVVALHPGSVALDPGWRVIKVKPLHGGSGHAWEQGPLWRVSRKCTLLTLGNSGPVLHQRHVLALHDANLWDIPAAFSPRYRSFHRFLRPVLARRAKALITVSHFSAEALARRIGVDPDRFTVIANAAEHILSIDPDPLTLNRFGLGAEGYLLAVGNQSPNKNIERLIKAHSSAGAATLPLVVAGGHCAGLSRNSPVSGERVFQLGRVSEAELRALYDGAAGFIFPSLYEGFGIPPLEAMQLGVPVLAARRAALPEILDNAPLWFDPLSVPDMARALREFSALGCAERQRMTNLGHRRAERFRWESSAERLASVLCSVVAPDRASSAAPSPAGRFFRRLKWEAARSDRGLNKKRPTPKRRPVQQGGQGH